MEQGAHQGKMASRVSSVTASPLWTSAASEGKPLTSWAAVGGKGTEACGAFSAVWAPANPQQAGINHWPFISLWDLKAKTLGISEGALGDQG